MLKHLWQSTRYTANACRIPDLSMGRSPRRLSEVFADSPYAFPRYNKKDDSKLKLSQCSIKQMAASICQSLEGCTMHELQTLDERQAQSSGIV